MTFTSKDRPVHVKVRQREPVDLERLIAALIARARLALADECRARRESDS